MLAMVVVKNGRQLCVAGADDLGVLSASFSAGGLLGLRTWDFTGKQAKPHMHLHVGGLTSRKEEADAHVDWIGHMEIELGDEITLRFVEIDKADAPAEVRPAKAKSPSSDEREYFKMLEQQYLSMRKKFRPKERTARSPWARAKSTNLRKRGRI